MKNLALLLFIAPIISFAQKLENVKAITQGEKIIISYDINGTWPGDKCDIQVYASYNNFSVPLQHLSGDVGMGLSPGKGKKIEWEAKRELGNFQGELSFEIKAEVIAIMAFRNPVSNAKRGKPVSIAWRGGTKNQDVKVELLKEGVSQGTLGTVSNNGSYQWIVPIKQGTGGGYQIKLANGKEAITTEYFSIKHKVPTLLKIFPLVAAGAAVGLLGGSGGSSKTPSRSSNLASPPDLGLN